MLGIDDFALKPRHRYATVIVDAETGERIDVLPDRTAETPAAWLREHPRTEYVCRDGSTPMARRSAKPSSKQRRSATGGTCGATCAARS
ncbi:hypothetical protein GCM10010430_68040 [Kitasatospora cystarginea]|uniref:Transposase IS204/IS1001/IS1096/IS1165 DDE domain-containing protein n=1 Tax=Kitasatospora cystarginea TaxID=58350 RepID=A0ABN3EUW2_9ACTN